MVLKISAVAARPVTLKLLLGEPAIVLEFAHYIFEILLLGVQDEHLGGPSCDVELVDVEAADLTEAHGDLIKDVPHDQSVGVVDSRQAKHVKSTQVRIDKQDICLVADGLIVLYGEPPHVVNEPV